jgi:hypothetical protein
MIKNIIIVLQAIALAFCVFVAWDAVTVKMHVYDRRLSALEQEARPLFVVDKYSSVYLNAEKVPWDDEDELEK